MTAPAAAIRHLETPFGALDVPEAQILHFAEGIRGLGSCRSWVLLGGDSPDRLWLQSADEPGLALQLLDPFATFAGYALDVPPAAVQALGAAQADELLVFAPVTLGHRDQPTTANLRGPILINWNTHRGLQLVVDAGPWSVREVVPAAPAEALSVG